MTAYTSASLLMADIIEDYDFGLRQWKALGLVRRLSFGAGKTEAEIPELRYWVKALRISRGNVSETLSELKRMQVLEQPRDGIWAFRLPVDQWRVARRTEAIEVINQLGLFEENELLQVALRQTFVEQAAVASRSAAATDGPEMTGPKRPGVPESGTPGAFPNRERSKACMPAWVSSTVPESGTPECVHASLQVLETCKGKSCKDASLQACMVPESGHRVGVPPMAEDHRTVLADGHHHQEDLQPCRLAPREALKGKLDEERQRILDELEDVGAFGVEEGSKWNWVDFVRRRPQTAEWLLGELKYARTREIIRNPGAWMMSKWIWKGRPND